MPTRRQFVTTLAAGAAGTAVATGGVAAQATDLTEWFANTDGAGEVVDRTGESEVTVTVGAEGNGGGFGFGPPPSSRSSPASPASPSSTPSSRPA
jgi:hypothetical protein